MSCIAYLKMNATVVCCKKHYDIVFWWLFGDNYAKKVTTKSNVRITMVILFIKIYFSKSVYI